MYDGSVLYIYIYIYMPGLTLRPRWQPVARTVSPRRGQPGSSAHVPVAGGNASGRPREQDRRREDGFRRCDAERPTLHTHSTHPSEGAICTGAGGSAPSRVPCSRPTRLWTPRAQFLRNVPEAAGDVLRGIDMSYQLLCSLLYALASSGGAVGLGVWGWPLGTAWPVLARGGGASQPASRCTVA